MNLLKANTYSCVATVCFRAADCFSDGDVDAVNSIDTSTLIAPPVVGGGVCVGSKVGMGTGARVGSEVGKSVGRLEGEGVGSKVGTDVGCNEGARVGSIVGGLVGATLMR